MVPRFLASFDTGLKPGVNETSQVRAFEAKPCPTKVGTLTLFTRHRSSVAAFWQSRVSRISRQHILTLLSFGNLV